jgi:polar amino acid transport system substrate-binding protein
VSLPRTSILTVLAVSALALTACTADPVDTPASGGSGSATAAAGKIADQELNQELHERLPQGIKDSGKIVAVNTGSFPPYTIIAADNAAPDGATAELSVALEQILGVEIEHETIDGLASVLSGMEAGRYDLDLGPVGDFPERQQQATFVDWVQEFVVFAVQKGNPKSIDGLETTCGTKIAVQAAGSAERVIKEQADKCVAEGKPAIDVQSYKDQPSAILAVQSNRADAFFSSQAPLTYFVEQSDGKLELTGQGKSNGFDDLYQGAVVQKDSPLAEVLLEAFQILHENGTYDAVMRKWGLDGNMLDEPGVNLGGS